MDNWTWKDSTEGNLLHSLVPNFKIFLFWFQFGLSEKKMPKSTSNVIVPKPHVVPSHCKGDIQTFREAPNRMTKQNRWNRILPRQQQQQQHSQVSQEQPLFSHCEENPKKVIPLFRLRNAFSFYTSISAGPLPEAPTYPLIVFLEQSRGGVDNHYRLEDPSTSPSEPVPSSQADQVYCFKGSSYAAVLKEVNSIFEIESVGEQESAKPHFWCIKSNTAYYCKLYSAAYYCKL